MARCGRLRSSPSSKRCGGIWATEAADRLGSTPGTSQSVGARVCREPGGHYPPGVPATLCARVESSRIPLGALEAYELANFCPKVFAELTVHARAKLRRTQRRKALIAAFWKQAELPI